MAQYNPLEHLQNALNATVVAQNTITDAAHKAAQEAGQQQPPTPVVSHEPGR